MKTAASAKEMAAWHQAKETQWRRRHGGENNRSVDKYQKEKKIINENIGENINEKRKMASA
jgi:hypothetical protein